MNKKVMSKITITEQINELDRHERLFCALFNKYRWLSLLGIHPLTTYRSLENPNELDLEFELIEIDNYLMNHAKEKNHSRIWYKDSWIQGIQKWLNTTKRVQINQDLFVSIGDMIPKEETKEDKRSDEEIRYDDIMSQDVESSYRDFWPEVLSYIVGKNTRFNLFGILGYLGQVESRMALSKDRIESCDHKPFIKWVIAQTHDIIGSSLTDIWIKGKKVEILAEPELVEPKEEPELVQPKKENVISFPKELAYDPEKGTQPSLAELRALIRKHRSME